MRIKVTPLKAIRAKCLDCSAQQPKEVRLCPETDCPLYPFRFGTNPNRKGIHPKNSAIIEKSRVESGKTEKEDA